MIFLLLKESSFLFVCLVINGLLFVGGTYILFNKQMKANKREQIQFGVPIFGHIKDDTTVQEQKSKINSTN